MTKSTSETSGSPEELKARLNMIRSIHLVFTAVFCLIILAWIVFGYWSTNLPVFISTLAMAVAVFVIFVAMRSGLAKSLKRLESGPP